MKLTLRIRNQISSGKSMNTGEASEYDVLGLPPRQTASIVMRDTKWSIDRAPYGAAKAQWEGAFDSAEDALRSLQKGL